VRGTSAGRAGVRQRRINKQAEVCCQCIECAGVWAAARMTFGVRAARREASAPVRPANPRATSTVAGHAALTVQSSRNLLLSVGQDDPWLEDEQIRTSSCMRHAPLARAVRRPARLGSRAAATTAQSRCNVGANSARRRIKSAWRDSEPKHSPDAHRQRPRSPSRRR